MVPLFLIPCDISRKAIGPYCSKSTFLFILHLFPAQFFAWLLIFVTLMGCGNGKNGKIRLHARDSTDAAMAGKWILVKKNITDSLLAAGKIVTGFILNEDHSAIVFTRGTSAIKEFRARWVRYPAPRQGEDRSATHEKTIIVIKGTQRNEEVPCLELKKIRENNVDVLFISNGGYFKKAADSSYQ